ncbi:hypothetical protein PCANC_12274 [Puccinia coronata f. sp. avenae]|uniref:Uncharacterized protein n=1 Tax=Puccinia coronata f. sp. avenae TaxID=200324 RepID=A0A2N5SZ44_9BASI|nr:hypothetical protein PCANC_12274 [Puccinia coronata f. sp. avenae]
MGARASSGRFDIEAPVGRSMEASSGPFLTEAPVGCYYKASSGCLCQVAPIGRFQKASNGRFNIKAPTGHFQKAPTLLALTGQTRLFKRCLNSRDQPVVGRALSNQSKSQQACATRRQVLWSESACPTTGQTRLF